MINTQIMETQDSLNHKQPVTTVVATFGAHITNQSVTMTINEPQLGIVLTLSTYAADADDEVTANITISHTSASTSAAYDIFASSTIPSWYHIQSGSMYINGSTDWSKNITGPPVPYYNFGNSSEHTNTSIYIPYLGVGSTVYFTFKFKLDNHTLTDQYIVLPAVIDDYASAPNSTLENRRLVVYSSILSRYSLLSI